MPNDSDEFSGVVRHIVVLVPEGLEKEDIEDLALRLLSEKGKSAGYRILLVDFVSKGLYFDPGRGKEIIHERWLIAYDSMDELVVYVHKDYDFHMKKYIEV